MLSVFGFFGPSSPPNWLYKSHALQQYIQASQGVFNPYSQFGLFGPSQPPNWEFSQFTLEEFLSFLNETYDSFSIWDSETEEGNISMVPLVVSPSLVLLEISAAGQPILGDVTLGRQQFDYSEYSLSRLDWITVQDSADGSTATYYLNDLGPSQIQLIATQSLYAPIAWEGPILDDYINDPEGDTLVWDALQGDALPSGITIQGVTLNPGEPGQRIVQRIRGTAAVGTAGVYNITLRATDIAGKAVTLSPFVMQVTAAVQVPFSDSATQYLNLVSDLFSLGLVEQLEAVLDGVVPVGNVVQTSPAPLTWVVPGSIVFVQVSGIAVPQVDAPGTTEAVAVSTVIGVGLTASVVGVTGSAIPQGQVIQQIPPKDTVLFPLATVTIYVSAEQSNVSNCSGAGPIYDGNDLSNLVYV